MKAAGQTITVDVESTDTVLDVKRKIQENRGIPIKEQNLAFGIKHLKDNCTLTEYLIGNGSNLKLCWPLKGGDPESGDSPDEETAEEESTDEETEDDESGVESGDSYNYHYLRVSTRSVNNYSTDLNVEKALDRVGTGYASRYIQTIASSVAASRLECDAGNCRAISEVLASKKTSLIIMFDYEQKSKSACLGHEATILERSNANGELEGDPEFVLWNVRDERENLEAFGKLDFFFFNF